MFFPFDRKHKWRENIEIMWIIFSPYLDLDIYISLETGY